ncbi:unnamed protein product [Paramecium pentaurelia]|uniref:SIS domain-containing protein n=1 Tax=Paramecium pentaurelia TaxID=43138 RepID=A0A8S1TED5_9CILI|nr:unnamed protein product [Paramecium pentaurelia]
MNYKDFLEISAQFSLGGLITEQSHPHTIGLSEFAKNDLKTGIQRMKDLDMHVFDVLMNKLDQLEHMNKMVLDTWSKGNRVFICGCGSTGRLALTLETLYRQITKQTNVISFMAGGDVAIIASVEDFEDHPEFGAQQLNELGFKEGDLLISSTEGGETPWVIGAVQEASKIGKPFFLYCNPDEVLTVQRSQDVFNNQNINKINLSVGHQAITGSTRMQCSTVLTYAIGLAILCKENFIDYATNSIKNVRQYYESIDAYQFIAKFIELEADCYLRKEYVFYRSKPNIAINILTDTTERCPTFSLHPFESILDNPINPSWSYFVMDDSETKYNDSLHAWESLLYGRQPRALSSNYWHKYQHKVGLEKLLSHDISQDQIERRIKYAGGNHYQFRIVYDQDNLEMSWEFLSPNQERIHFEKIQGINDVLGQNIILKCLINIHSTLLMGRIGRYQSNIMIYVRPTNNKLIDRAIRYVQYLLKQNNVVNENITYALVCENLFEEIKTLVYGESIVLKTFERVKKLFSL